MSDQFWQYIEKSATSRRCRFPNSSWSFDTDFDLHRVDELLLSTRHLKPVNDNAAAEVRIFGRHVVKEDCRPLRRRFKARSLYLNPRKGLTDLPGEAVNTLVASTLGVPSHSLRAMGHNHLTRQTWLCFERLDGNPLAARMAQDTVTDLLQVVFDFLTDTLRKGVFHGDCNLSNILIDNHPQSLRFIDFDCLLPRMGRVADALALQLAVLRDWRLAPFIEQHHYEDLAETYLGSRFSAPGAIDLFRQYSGRQLCGADRRQRLRTVCPGSVNILNALGQHDLTKKIDLLSA